MVLQFMGNLVGVKASQAVSAAMEALVRFDPKGATEAELRTMEQNLDALGRQVAEARQSYDHEEKEYETMDALSHQRMAAAEQLERQAGTETDPARKTSLEGSLATLVGMMEKMAPDIDRAKKDSADAKDFVQQLEAAYAEAGGKLKEARSQLEQAQRDMARAAQQRQTAERQAEAARAAAGLTQTTNSLTVALKSMQQSAASDQVRAEAALAKARLLRPTTPEQDDPNIAAALAAASGKGPAPATVAERLAALKART